MTRVETSVVVNRPSEEVFAFVADVENNPLWQSGMQEAKITFEGPIDVGTTYSQLAKFLAGRLSRPLRS
ncbi:MAG: SRPBCC family protein [Candidatus Promineifilaceae bacterium]